MESWTPIIMLAIVLIIIFLFLSGFSSKEDLKKEDFWFRRGYGRYGRGPCMLRGASQNRCLHDPRHNILPMHRGRWRYDLDESRFVRCPCRGFGGERCPFGGRCPYQLDAIGRKY